MPFSKINRPHTFNGILFTALFASLSYYLATIDWIMKKGFSPLVIAIVLGMIYGSTLRGHLPQEWNHGIKFIAKRILRLAIVFYGFRLTFQEVFHIGFDGFILDLLIVCLTLFAGAFIGIKLFKLDRDTSILISSGAAICGAAAVLATEGILKNDAHKTSVAVLSVVLFGTIAMFLYPFLQHNHFFGLDASHYAIYAGATIHEVAQVLIAGTNISPEAGHIAVIVKMTRVIMLAPALILLNFILARTTTSAHSTLKIKDTIPWFAIFFIMVIGFNSLHVLPQFAVQSINTIDTFLLTLAMAALGIDTDLRKVWRLGLRPLYFSLFLFAWLIGGGYLLSHIIFKWF